MGIMGGVLLAKSWRDYFYWFASPLVRKLSFRFSLAFFLLGTAILCLPLALIALLA